MADQPVSPENNNMQTQDKKDLKSVMSKLFDKMTLGQKIIIGGVSFLSIVMIIGVFAWATSTDYSLLYPNLTQEDAASIVTKLAEQGVEYKLKGNGNIIYVPSEQVNDIKLTLASEGLPSESTMGYEIFDNSKLGMTDFMQQVNKKRALEGELARTISAIKGVSSARVQIVLPKRALFQEDKKEPKASVFLVMKSRAGLSSGQIDGVLHLVANSVEGLKASNISIHDNYGNRLDDSDDLNTITGITSAQYKMQRSIEAQLEMQVQTMLDQILGENKSVVRVNAELNFEKVEQVLEEYNPDVQVLRSEERQTSEGTGGPTGDLTTESSTSNYEINRSTSTVSKSVGDIEKISIAVSVDGVYEKIKDADGVERIEYRQRSQQELDMLAAQIKNSVGFSADRGDQFEIANLRFTQNDNLAEAQGLNSETVDLIKYGLKYGAAIILILIALFVFRSLLVRSREFSQKIWPKLVSSEVAGKMMTPDGKVVDSEFLKEEFEEKEKRRPKPKKKIEEEIDEQVRERVEKQDQIREFVKNKSIDATNLLKSWLYEREDDLALNLKALNKQFNLGGEINTGRKK